MDTPTSSTKSSSPDHELPEDELYVTKPFLPPLAELYPALNQIWESRKLTNKGPFHRRLERDLAEFLDVHNISLFSNGTIALITAIKALDLRGEVITTPFTFPATSHAILWNGLTPVFADIDPVTLNLSPVATESAITSETRAIVPVHCYGTPCDVVSFDDIARRHELPIVYDAAHAFGVQHNGRSLLSYGDFSVLSFHATKVFNTFEGGAIVSATSDARKKIDFLRNFGFVDETHVEMVGGNGKMNEFSAALGLLQLKYVNKALARRAKLDGYYRQCLAEIVGIRCVPRHAESSNYAYFPVLVDDGFPLDRDTLYERLKAHGIFSRRYFFPLVSDFPMYRHLPSADPANLPVATEMAKRILCLPFYTELTERDIDRVTLAIRDARNRAGASRGVRSGHY